MRTYQWKHGRRLWWTRLILLPMMAGLPLTTQATPARQQQLLLQGPQGGAWYAAGKADASRARYLILADQRFSAAVDRLREYRAQDFQVTVESVTPETTQETIRSIIRQHADPDSFVLLVGRCETVACDIITEEGDVYRTKDGKSEKESYTRQYNSDAAYADLNDDLVPDLFVGRIPVETTAELEAIVDKVISYEKGSSLATPEYLFVAGSEITPEQRTEQPNNMWKTGSYFDEQLIPVVEGEGTVERIYCYCQNTSDGCQGNTDQLVSSMNNGASVVTFMGHATQSGIENQCCYKDSFNAERIDGDLVNYGRYPIFVGFSCNIADLINEEYYLDGRKSFGEEILKIPQAGAVAFVGSSATTGLGVFDAFAPSFYAALSDPSMHTLGEAFCGGKRKGGKDKPKMAERMYQQLQLFGDPALRIH